jgi:small multidrug resistance family-3 protein
MSRSTGILVLFAAAVLEAGGDAIVRVALHTSAVWPRVLLFVLAAAVLFSYGYLVNAPAWDFGKLLGLYVVFFFVIAQHVSWLFFNQPPSPSVVIGGLLIMSGGLVIALNN